MASLSEFYNSRLSAAKSVEQKVRNTLQGYANQYNFIVISRVKSFESMLDKAQSGRYASISHIDDFVACSIIIDTRSQERDVIKFVKKVFDVKNVKSNTATREENSFVFDCTRIYAKLIDTKPSTLPNMIFEVQIRTILQHAWSKITHSEVYKPLRISSKKTRLAAEVMAHIESLDRIFSTFSTTAKGVRKIKRSVLEQPNVLLEKFEGLIHDGIVPQEFQPKSNRRLAENIINMLRAKDGDTLYLAASAIDDFFRAQKQGMPTSLSLYELSLVALKRARLLKRNPKPYYISSELLTLYPETGGLSPTVELPELS